MDLDPAMEDMKCTLENYLNWRKEIIAHIKEFDKLYLKHIKSPAGYNLMNNIHMKAMKPLTDIFESNLNFHYLEEIIAKNPKIPVPKFRYEALETKFAEHLDILCILFRDHGQLDKLFHIRNMLNLLKVDKWKEIPPFSFYLTPLYNAITEQRKCLLDMNAAGVLKAKYFVE